jgi:hypothetical protein
VYNAEKWLDLDQCGLDSRPEASATDSRPEASLTGSYEKERKSSRVWRWI